ncbi:MAG: hypothetical protein JW797_18390 [Bradymonadales bacterium]|nr:hypothetical protein [Bradymonadales bacterium]
MQTSDAKKRRTTPWTLIALVALTLPLVMGAQRCGNMRAVTDAGEYETGQTGYTTLFNETNVTAYLPGCATFNYEHLVSGTWRDMGPNRYCVWEGYVQPLRKDTSLRTPFTIGNAGTWRLRYSVSFGCTEGQPMSRANCDSTETYYTSDFGAELDACSLAEIECDEMDGVFNPETCTCCRPGAHEVQECEFGRGSTFDYMACECHCVYNSDCPFGQECDDEGCVDSECHWGYPADEPPANQTIPPRECPEDYNCMMGDGVDMYHGNGWCEPD